MPSIITASQLRTVLGVSSSLYSDAYLEGIINTAEGVILPLLEANTNTIQSYKILDGSAIYTTQLPNMFVEGQSVVISGVDAELNGTKTVTDTYRGAYMFSVNTSEADTTYATALIPQGVVYLTGKDAATIYAADPNIENAVLIVSVEIFQSITAAGGQIEGVDFQPSPYRMGRSLAARVYSLLARYTDTASIAQ